MKKTWPEIWLEIAAAYWTPYIKRTGHQAFMVSSGLCMALEAGAGYPHYRIPNKALKPGGYGFWWNRDREGDILRAQFAEHMAGIPHEDFEEFIK